MHDSALFIAVLLASAVEAVEATTIVLAAGTARDWRSALYGTGSALLVLAAIIGIAGPAISFLPINDLRLVVGGLLLVFGLQWIRKAILRGSGYKALHDEDAIFRRELAAAKSAGRQSRGRVEDWYAFTLSFKGVLLEGLEVVFIVLTFGTIQHNVGLASLAAVIAVVLVAVAGYAVRKPLARVPENTMKFVVGIMLTSFGIFWGAEGAGAVWPGADAALLGVVAVVAVVSLGLVVLLRNHRRRREVVFVPTAGTASAGHGPESGPTRADAVSLSPDPPQHPEPVDSGDRPRRSVADRVVAFGAFWYDFVFGDDWQVTVGIVVALALTGWLSAANVVSWWLMPVVVLLLVLPYSLGRAIRAGR